MNWHVLISAAVIAGIALAVWSEREPLRELGDDWARLLEAFAAANQASVP